MKFLKYFVLIALLGLIFVTASCNNKNEDSKVPTEQTDKPIVEVLK